MGIGLTLIIGTSMDYETSKPNRHVVERQTINGARSLSNTVSGPERPTLKKKKKKKKKKALVDIDREPQTLLLNKTVPSEVFCSCFSFKNLSFWLICAKRHLTNLLTTLEQSP